MSKSPDNVTAVSSGWPVWGLLLTISGPFVYMGLLDNPAVRSSGAPAFGLMAAGVALGLHAARRRRRPWVVALAAANVVLLGLWAYAFLWYSVLPDSSATKAMVTAPEFTLPAHDGEDVSLSEARANGPVLLVFYRGHW